MIITKDNFSNVFDSTICLKELLGDRIKLLEVNKSIVNISVKGSRRGDSIQLINPKISIINSDDFDKIICKTSGPGSITLKYEYKDLFSEETSSDTIKVKDLYIVIEKNQFDNLNVRSEYATIEVESYTYTNLK